MNASSEVIQKLKTNDSVLATAKAIGPEKLHNGMTNEPIFRNLLGTVFGAGADRIMEMVTDSNTDLVNDKAVKEFFKFFPAGSPFKCFEHFRQIMLTGKFASFKFETEE